MIDDDKAQHRLTFNRDYAVGRLGNQHVVQVQLRIPLVVMTVKGCGAALAFSLARNLRPEYG